MQVFHPETESDFRSRNDLLTATLRDGHSPYEIAAEYPLVLAPAYGARSHCLRVGGEIIAHANLWPRKLVDLNSGTCDEIGLVGNVATAVKWQGQGVMRDLLRRLKETAANEGLKALVLWSDLSQFYQKQGFTSFGRERRYTLKVASVKRPKGRSEFLPLAKERAASLLLARRLPLRRTIARSQDETDALLTIPGVLALGSPDLDQHGGTIALLGRGVDMAHVIHEWGAPTAEDLIAAAISAGALAGYSEVMILAPCQLPPGWDEKLRRVATNVEDHPVAMAWTESKETAQRLEQSFIWGLDSI